MKPHAAEKTFPPIGEDFIQLVEICCRAEKREMCFQEEASMSFKHTCTGWLSVTARKPFPHGNREIRRKLTDQMCGSHWRYHPCLGFRYLNIEVCLEKLEASDKKRRIRHSRYGTRWEEMLTSKSGRMN